MKSTDIAFKYGLDNITVKDYIKKNATFSITENFLGDIILPDDLDIQVFFYPLLAPKIEQERKLEEEKRRKEKEEFYKQKESFDKIELLRQQEEEIERKEKEAFYNLRLEKLKSKNVTGYYEYKAISLSDVGGIFKSNSGSVDTEKMTQRLNELGMDGWRLVTAYSNELGKNALSGGAGGAMLGVNSTVDENILIFERFVQF